MEVVLNMLHDVRVTIIGLIHINSKKQYNFLETNANISLIFHKVQVINDKNSFANLKLFKHLEEGIYSLNEIMKLKKCRIPLERTFLKPHFLIMCQKKYFLIKSFLIIINLIQ